MSEKWDGPITMQEVMDYITQRREVLTEIDGGVGMSESERDEFDLVCRLERELPGFAGEIEQAIARTMNYHVEYDIPVCEYCGKHNVTTTTHKPDCSGMDLISRLRVGSK